MKKYALICLMVAAVMSVACDDDYFEQSVTEPQYSDIIGYDVNVNGQSFNNGDNESRNSAGGHYSHVSVEQLDQTLGGKSVYLHTVIKDIIEEPVASPESRGTTIKTGDLNDIKVSAYTCNADTWNWDNAQAFMYNYHTSGTAWATDRFWPKEQKYIRFYGFAPISAVNEGDGVIDNLPEDVAEPSFGYEVPAEIKNQTDLLVASAQYSGGYCQRAHLPFAHALTKVEIILSHTIKAFKFNKAEISGLKYKGTYTYGYAYGNTNYNDVTDSPVNSDAGSWIVNNNEKTSYTLYDDGYLLCNGEEPDYYLTNPPNFLPPTTTDTDNQEEFQTTLAMMLMPQELDEGAVITISGYDEAVGTDVTLTAKIGGEGKKWNKGEHVVYTLSLNDATVTYYLKVEPQASAIDVNVTPSTIPFYGAKEVPFTVKSYKKITRGTVTSDYIAVPWKIYDGETEVVSNVNGWLTFSQLNGVGSKPGGDPETRTFDALSSSPVTAEGDMTPSHKRIFEKTHLGTAETPYDLSTNQPYAADKKPNHTANCYIISAPGYYTFPLVYGNAMIPGNTDNKSAYNNDDIKSEETKSVTSKNYDGTTNTDHGWNDDGAVSFQAFYLKNFVDHNGKGINGPWITDAYTASSAEVVWQDEPCLVTDVKLSNDNKYITFRVHEDCVTEGNAVICVKEEGTNSIMWSWHIWVTDYWNEYDNGQIVGVGNGYDFSYNRIVKNRRMASATQTNDNLFVLMSNHLGHCDGENKYYNKREKTYTIKQVDDKIDGVVEGTESGTTDDGVEYGGTLLSGKLTIVQKEGSVSTIDNAPYYQAGRKDPMLPCATGDGSTKLHYAENRKQSSEFTVVNSQATLADAIKHPDIMYYNGTRDGSTLEEPKIMNTWCSDGPYYNLWNARCDAIPMFTYVEDFVYNPYNYFTELNVITDEGVTKTVYDPCPPTYEMPRVDAFTGATIDGTNFHPYYLTATALDNRANLYEPSNNNNGAGGKYDLNGLFIPCETKPYSNPATAGTGYFNAEDATTLLFTQFLGHRKYTGEVAEYGNYAAAMTANPLAVQWLEQATEDKNKVFLIEHARLCIIRGSGSLRVVSTSAFDLAFGIIPAVTGANAADSWINATHYWSTGTDHNSSYDVGF